MSLDYDQILHGNPTKNLMIRHRELQENYTEEKAQDSSKLYTGQPLSFLLENSRFVFSEPTYGYPYYIDQVTSKEHMLECVPAYPEEHEKVHLFLVEHRDAMQPDQIEMFESLENRLGELSDSTKHLRMLLEYMTERFGEDEMDATITTHPMVYLSLTPFELMKEDADPEILERVHEIGQLLLVGSNDTDKWKEMFESATTAGLLMQDSAYVEAVNAMPRDFRNVVKHLSTISLGNQIRSINDVEQKPDDLFMREYVSPEYAVESIFGLMNDSEEYSEIFEAERAYYGDLAGYAYDLLSSLATFEYTHCEDPGKPITGFQGIFDENTTVEEAMNFLASQASQYEAYTEASNDDLGEPSPTVRDSAGSYGEVGKKAVPPSPKSAAQSAQFKMMDKEAKSYQYMAKAKAKGDAIKGAAKAASAIPKNIKSSIDDTVDEWDKMDDERRRKFMVKPGYRKKIFRKIKLALLYGASAQVSLLMVPVTMICRHYSKIKDGRIRTELARELDTEIQVCQAKIDDANSESDKTEKYKLMRIKSKLEAERDRVKYNSHYL